ncbi:MAG: TerC family protein [Fimbriiglobus sp.]
MNLRRVLAVFLGAWISLLALQALWAAEEPTSKIEPGGIQVEVKTKDGANSYPTEFLAKTLRIQAQYGVVELDLNKTKLLEFLPPEEGQTRWNVNVSLMDKTHLSGPLLVDQLPVKDANQQVGIPPEKLESIKFLHPKNTSLVAALIGLFTLAMMEIVLGVDNVIFLAILAGKLPEAERPRARNFGLAAALGTRLILLFCLSWLMGLVKPLIILPPLPFLQTLEARGISGRDLVLLLGGMFLIWKSVREMHHKVEAANQADDAPKKVAKFWNVIIMIAIADLVFSLDSVITAVGMVDEIWVMVVAMVIAMVVMLVFAGPISRFVDTNPTIKILALSFLVLIGVILIAEGLGQHIDKGYIYFAMSFALIVELINMQLRTKKPHAVETAKV